MANYNNNNGDLCDPKGENPYATTTRRGMLCAEEEKWACPICRDIVEDLTCEVAKSSLVVCCKNRCTHRGHDLTDDRAELMQRLNCAQKRLEIVESQNQGLRAQLITHGDRIEHLQNISYEKNSILLERQETVDELTRTNSRLWYQIQNMERKLRDCELDKHQVSVSMSEKLRHLQQNLSMKDGELQSVTERLNETSQSLEIVNEKYSQLETLLSSVYKENAQFKFELKKREIEIVENNKKLKSIAELKKKIDSLREKNKVIDTDFTLVFREYAFICSLLIKERGSFDEVKSYAEDTFYTINSYLQSGERADVTIEMEYKKLLNHPKHKELAKKLEETLRVTQALIDASEQLRNDKQRLENTLEIRERKLQECIIKLKKLMFWSKHVEEQKKKLKTEESPVKETVVLPCKVDAECQTDIQFGGAPSVKFKEIVEQVLRNSNTIKLESENDALQSENLKLREELTEAETHITLLEKNIDDISNFNFELKQELDFLRTKCNELLQQNVRKTEELVQCDELRRDAELRVNELLERPFLPERTARKRWRKLFAHRSRRNDSSPLTPVLLPRHWMTERHVTPQNVEPSSADVSDVELSFVQRQNVVKETMNKVREEISNLMQIYDTDQLRESEVELKLKIENLCAIVTDILNEEIE